METENAMQSQQRRKPLHQAQWDSDCGGEPIGDVSRTPCEYKWKSSPSRRVGASAEAAWNTNLLNTTNLQKHWKTRDETTTSAIGDFAVASSDRCTLK